MKKVFAIIGVAGCSLGAWAQSTNFSTNASFLTSFQPLVTLPQFDAVAIGNDLGQIIQLSSVTLSLTGSITGTLTATNTLGDTRTLTSLQIRTILFSATTTNVPGIGVDLIAKNASSFDGPDVADPDLLLAALSSTNFPNTVSPTANYTAGHPPVISSAIRSAYTGTGDIEILLAAIANGLGSFQDGILIGLEDVAANMTATLTYTWEVIPEPGVWVGLAAAAGLTLVARLRRRQRRS